MNFPSSWLPGNRNNPPANTSAPAGEGNPPDDKDVDPYPFASMRISADVVQAAGLRNGMSPRDVHEAIARLPNPPAITKAPEPTVEDLPEYHKMRVPLDVLQMAGVTNGMAPRDLDRAVHRIVAG